MNNRINKGFTLIELLVAMGIVALLMGMVIFNFNISRIRARDIQRKNDLSQLQKALELYKNDNNGLYPPSSDFQKTLQDADYIKTTFNDPRIEWMVYGYAPSPDSKTYYLMACLENKTDKTKATEGCDDFGSSSCSCGKDTADNAGVMYTLSQP